MLEGALLVVCGIKRDADERHHDRQQDDAREKVHDLEFTYLIYATLDLAMNKVDADTEHMNKGARGVKSPLDRLEQPRAQYATSPIM
jgi:hypothetical protein